MAGVGLKIDASAATASVAACLVEVEVRQVLNAPSLALLTLAQPPREVADSFAIGTALELSAPDGTHLFGGEVTGIGRSLNGAGAQSLTVRAYDRLHRLRKQQSLRHLNGVGLEDLASLLVGTLGLEVECPQAPDRKRVLVQHRQSDFDLLTELSAEAGLCFWLNNETLQLLSLGGDGGEEARLTAGANILEITTDITAEPMRKASHALAWEVASNQVLKGDAGMAAQDALEMRLDAVAAFEGLGERFIVNRMCDTADEARRLAQNDIDRATARGLRVDALCEGEAGYRPGRIVRVEGIGSEVDGPFVLSAVTHKFDASSGYTTRISTEPPQSPTPPLPSAAVTLGVVVETDDPEGRARVKARLPVFGDVLGDWMPVLSMGAGKTKGFTIIPEPDDDVLVLLPDGNPARGIVLGGLYGSNAAPGERPSQGARSFVVRSPSGPQITLDGCRALIRLESGDGDIIEMGPEQTLIRAKRDMIIEAPGRTLKIRAAKVEFERA